MMTPCQRYRHVDGLRVGRVINDAPSRGTSNSRLVSVGKNDRVAAQREGGGAGIEFDLVEDGARGVVVVGGRTQAGAIIEEQAVIGRRRGAPPVGGVGPVIARAAAAGPSVSGGGSWTRQE